MNPTGLKLAEVLGSVAARFQAEVQRPLGLIAQYNNDPPIDADSLVVASVPSPGDGVAWCKVRVEPTDPARPELGPDALTFYAGVLRVSVLCPAEKGQGLSDPVVAAVIALQQKAVGRVHYRTAGVLEVGRSADGSWWEVMVTVPFRFAI